MNQTRHGVFYEYLESKAKRFFAIACLGKKLVFQRKFANFASNEF